ncbi:TrmO family methyltransferase [Myxococcota bacterium]
MELRPIGKVRRSSDTEVVLDLRRAYVEGLEGIAPGDTVQVLYWMHGLSHNDRRLLRVPPQGDTSIPVRGVFSLRSCVRPNPIGVSMVEVVRVEGEQLVVLGIDAQEGPPLIDIKAASR